jgi:hypothetical protein
MLHVQMEGQPPDLESNCEYAESTMDSWHVVIHQLGGWAGAKQPLNVKT